MNLGGNEEIGIRIIRCYLQNSIKSAFRQKSLIIFYTRILREPLSIWEWGHCLDNRFIQIQICL